MLFQLKYTLLAAVISAVSYTALFSQNTVGLISFDNDISAGGYNLIYPERQSNVFLINECGELVHIWEDAPENRPGKTAYLLEDGNLLRSKYSPEVGAVFGSGGSGGVVEILTWDNEVLWSYILADSFNMQHHDVHFMENGNVLLIAWELKGLEEMLGNGFDSSNYNQVELWPDYLREINPGTNEIEWEWHAWDHLIQDYDSTKNNFGNISGHPELIDLNYQEYAGGRQDWMHCNAIDYDPVKDQVMLSVRNFNEIWIIDHSTTIAEAAGHTGGNSGKGGDLLYRWGNPKAYKKGETADRKLFFQHDAQWIDDFVNPDYEYYGKIVLFNNFISVDISRGQILEPVWDTLTNSYLKSDGLYLPVDFSKTISHPNSDISSSGTASSIQIIGDGTVVICAARFGFAFELTKEGQVAWEYRTPMKQGLPVAQGTELSSGDNFTFQLERYPEDFSGFISKDLSPIGFIELEPNIGFCTPTYIEDNILDKYFELFPNPAGNHVFIKSSISGKSEWALLDIYGRAVLELKTNEKIFELDLHELQNGIYFLKENKSGRIKKLVVNKG
ncbi:MAG TPA: T9SS type A sorting domain-containing protein [Bacteroidetes bacterium]|nr:T9SS type A sorting domain-containing protein [Bacteroidota bacterium]